MSDPDPTPEEIGRKLVERAEAGDEVAAERLDTLEELAPEQAEAAEQESADGVEGIGLSR